MIAEIRENTRVVSELSQKSEIRIDSHDQVMAEIRATLQSASEISRENDIQLKHLLPEMAELRGEMRALVGRLDHLDTAIKIGSAVIAFAITTGVAVAAIVFG